MAFRLIGLEQEGSRHQELCNTDALVLLCAAPLCIWKLMLILPLQRLHFASGDSIFKALNISGRIFTSCHIPLLKFLVNRGRLWRLPTPERFFSQFFLLQGCLSQDLFSIPPEDFLSLGISLKSFLLFRLGPLGEFWYPLTSSCLWARSCSPYSVLSSLYLTHLSKMSVTWTKLFLMSRFHPSPIAQVYLKRKYFISIAKIKTQCLL